MIRTNFPSETSLLLRLVPLLLLLLPIALRAEGTAEGTPRERLGRRISLDLEAAPPADVFPSFARVLGAEPELSPEVEGEITIRLRDVSVATCLDAVCESIGCRWRLAAGEGSPRLVVEPLPPPAAEPPAALEETVSLSLKDAPARQVLASFARILGAEPAFHTEVEGAVTVELQDKPVGECLDLLCRQLGCRWRLAAGDPPLLEILPPG